MNILFGSIFNQNLFEVSKTALFNLKHLPRSDLLKSSDVSHRGFSSLRREEARDGRDRFVQRQPGDYKADFLDHTDDSSSHPTALSPQNWVK